MNRRSIVATIEVDAQRIMVVQRRENARQYDVLYRTRAIGSLDTTDELIEGGFFGRDAAIACAEDLARQFRGNHK